MRKRDFFKTLRQFIPATELKERFGEKGENDELWRFFAISVVKFFRYSFPVEIYRELLKYLYKARSKYDLKFRRRTGHWLPDAWVWGVNRLIVKDGIPINFL